MGLEGYLQESEPGVLEQVQEMGAKNEGKNFEEISRFKKASIVYDILVPEDERRLIQRPGDLQELADAREQTDIVVHMGCHVVETPHIVDAVVHIFEQLELTMVPLGGVNNCCGIQNLKAGDIDGAERVDTNRFSNIAAFDPDYALTECTSCHAVTEKLSLGHISPAFEVLSIFEFLDTVVDDLNAAIERTDPVTITLHDHYDGNGWIDPAQMAHARSLFERLPGVELVEMEHAKENALPCNFATDLSQWDCDNLSNRVLAEAETTGADYMIDFWHACHRDLVRYESEFDVTPVNYTTFIADRMGASVDDKLLRYNRMAGAEGIDRVLEELRPIYEDNDVSEDQARRTMALVLNPT